MESNMLCGLHGGLSSRGLRLAVLLCGVVVCGSSAVWGQRIQISPLSWDYGDVTVGTFETATFDIGSLGPTSVWTYVIALTDTPDIHAPWVWPDDPVDPLWSLGPFSFNPLTWEHSLQEIPAGDHFLVDVSFAPTSPGYFSTYLEILNNDAEGKDTMFLPLEGNGVLVPVPPAILLGALGMGTAGWICRRRKG